MRSFHLLLLALLAVIALELAVVAMKLATPAAQAAAPAIAPAPALVDPHDAIRTQLTTVQGELTTIRKELSYDRVQLEVTDRRIAGVAQRENDDYKRLLMTCFMIAQKYLTGPAAANGPRQDGSLQGRLVEPAVVQQLRHPLRAVIR